MRGQRGPRAEHIPAVGGGSSPTAVTSAPPFYPRAEGARREMAPPSRARRPRPRPAPALGQRGRGSALGVSRALRAERGAGPALPLLGPCSAPRLGLTLRGSRAPAAVSGGAAAGSGPCAAAGGGTGRGGGPGCADRRAGRRTDRQIRQIDRQTNRRTPRLET